MTEVTPQELDLDAWIDGAERPARSVTVYQKAGLVADLDALEEQIAAAELVPAEERALGESPSNLRAKYAALAEQFEASALVIRIEGRTREEREALNEAHKDLSAKELGAVIIADAMTYPKATAKQVARLNKVLGDAQFGRVLAAYNRANNEFPAVSADFLPKPSTPDDGSES